MRSQRTGRKQTELGHAAFLLCFVRNFAADRELAKFGLQRRLGCRKGHARAVGRRHLAAISREGRDATL